MPLAAGPAALTSPGFQEGGNEVNAEGGWDTRGPGEHVTQLRLRVPELTEPFCLPHSSPLLFWSPE